MHAMKEQLNKDILKNKQIKNQNKEKNKERKRSLQNENSKN